MPDVNDAIQNWRNALSAEEAIDQAVLDELQDQLEAELVRLPADVLDDNERVLLAARRVGAPDLLGRQFSPDRAPLIWARRLYWAAIGVVVVGLIGTVPLIAAIVFAAASNALLGAAVFDPRTNAIVVYLSTSVVWVAVALVLLTWRSGFFRPRRIGRFVSSHPFITICTGIAMLAPFPLVYDVMVCAYYGYDMGSGLPPFKYAGYYLANIVVYNLGPLILSLAAWRIMRTSPTAVRVV